MRAGTDISNCTLTECTGLALSKLCQSCRRRASREECMQRQDLPASPFVLGMACWNGRGAVCVYAIETIEPLTKIMTLAETLFPTRYRAPRKADAAFVYANDADNRLPPPPPSTEPDTPHGLFMSTSLFSMFSA